MSNLAAQKPKDTYQRLLQAPSWTNGASPVAIQLGDGTVVPIFISNTTLRVGAAGFAGVVQVWDEGLSAYVAIGGGGGGSDLNHVHTQAVPSATWAVTHNMGKRPAVSVVDSGGTQVYGDVDYDSADSLTITFSAGFAGVAYLN